MFPFTSDGICFDNSFLTWRFQDFDIPMFFKVSTNIIANRSRLKEFFDVQRDLNDGPLKREITKQVLSLWTSRPWQQILLFIFEMFASRQGCSFLSSFHTLMYKHWYKLLYIEYFAALECSLSSVFFKLIKTARPPSWIHRVGVGFGSATSIPMLIGPLPSEGRKKRTERNFENWKKLQPWPGRFWNPYLPHQQPLDRWLDKYVLFFNCENVQL